LSPIPRPLGKGDPTTPTTVARVPDPTPPPNSPSHPWGLFAAPDSAPPPRWRACGSRVLALGATALLANTSFLLGPRGVQQVTRFPIQTTTRILCFQFIVNFPPLHQNQWYVLALDWGIFQITENSISNFQPLHSTPPLPQRGDEARAGLAGLNQQFPRPPPAKPLPRGGGWEEEGRQATLCSGSFRPSRWPWARPSHGRSARRGSGTNGRLRFREGSLNRMRHSDFIAVCDLSTSRLSVFAPSQFSCRWLSPFVLLCFYDIFEKNH